ncbi:MAG: T9SS type A sorting domain-containing protein [Rhizobacter sp.]|nr:T9SS type A sorting domain-containing protein [Chlorobiales bacterium]
MKPSMKPFVVTLLLLLPSSVSAQAVFQSQSSGDWNAPATWQQVSGTSSTGYPVSADSVSVLSGHAVAVNISNGQCSKLSVSGGAISLSNSTHTLTVQGDMTLGSFAAVNVAAGAFSVVGNVTFGTGSVLTMTGGAFSVVGLLFLNAPAAAGTTLIDVQAGLFNCIGGMTITASSVPAGRFAELRIGNSSVFVAGALTTISSNARINFTGTGALSISGVFTTALGLTFTAGNGSVIYIGIPGTDQTVASLTYNRLTITGAGSGKKIISGAVIVTDTLSLLSDTLQVGSGSLTLNDGAKILRSSGRLLSPPTLLGSIDVVYNNSGVADTTGLELPASSALRNLTVNAQSGIVLAAPATVNGVLTLTQGALRTNANTLTVTNPDGGASGTSADPAIVQSDGFIAGALTRVIGASAGVRLFPFSTASKADRTYLLDFTAAPAAAGTLTVQHFDTAAPAQSGLPVIDGADTLTAAAPLYWRTDASGGLAGGTYSLSLAAEGVSGVTSIESLRLISRPASGGAWTAEGTAGTNSGTTAAPVVARDNLTTLSAEVSIGLPGGTSAADALPDAKPSSFALQQNYPNPFNPSTTIRYQLPISGEVSLKVFDVLGREVATLVDTKQAAGNYIVRFSASKLSSGVYFYRLQTGGAVLTKKMLLLK